MKRCLLWLSVLGCAGVQTGAPREGRWQREGEVTELSVHGIQVLVKTLPGQPLTSCQVYVRGGVRNWTAKDAGVERLALATALSGGTQSLAKPAFLEKLAALGTRLGLDLNEDGSVLSFKVLNRNFAPSLALLADAFLHPALPEPELELQRRLLLSELAQEDENADAKLLKLSHLMLYQGLPYAQRASGTPESVSGLTRAALVAHLAKLRETSRLLVVVVGGIGPEEVAAQIQASLGGLPRGDYRETPLRPPAFQAAAVQLVDRPLPTHYLVAAFPAPTWGSPELAAGIVAMSALQQELFEEVRTKRELSYAPEAGLSLRGLGEGYLYVSAVDIALTARVMQDVLHAAEAGGVSPAHLEGDKRTFLTEFLLQNESTSGQGELLARAQLVGGDWRLARDLPGRVAAVTPAEVVAFLKTHARNLQVVLLGATAGLAPSSFEGF